MLQYRGPICDFAALQVFASIADLTIVALFDIAIAATSEFRRPLGNKSIGYENLL
jgi:hypothetical protein